MLENNEHLPLLSAHHYCRICKQTAPLSTQDKCLHNNVKELHYCQHIFTVNNVNKLHHCQHIVTVNNVNITMSANLILSIIVNNVNVITVNNVFHYVNFQHMSHYYYQPCHEMVKLLKTSEHFINFHKLSHQNFSLEILNFSHFAYYLNWSFESF